MSSPTLKKSKLDPSCESVEQTCKHYVKRKKRFCKMTVANGKEYCGEHDVTAADENCSNRIPCPLDPKHTVYAYKLHKHLKICNAKPKENLPKFISTGINLGSDDEDGDSKSIPTLDTGIPKLSEISEIEVKKVVEIIEHLFDKYKIDKQIEEFYKTYPSVEEELTKPEYGPQATKHLSQVSSILGVMNDFNLLKNETCFIEFGAGKGQVSFWLATVSEQNNFSKDSVVLLIDRASHRHKQDNRIVDREIVRRVRVDIADFNMTALEGISKTKRIVGFGKHLCGAATDFTLRCIVSSNQADIQIPTDGIVIAFCCHHRCEWKSFVGKRFFLENGINRQLFSLIIRMVSWAICGTGMSRERRRELSEKHEKDSEIVDAAKEFVLDEDQTEHKSKLTREEREAIGYKCKRLIDYARVKYLEEHNFECFLKYYVRKDTTLENVCLVAKRKAQ